MERTEIGDAGVKVATPSHASKEVRISGLGCPELSDMELNIYL
ncbi:pollen-specific leucine-rich repeat extensin-like protein 3 [Iris pallida]|uniref:Pollen-specific leucine-rich repeat extensin-like protein 3 n=1 Tax=Iris pallida TaxID=29817 RepID=A0AAX6H3F3_IRIPA|nr:pollen-specific leucine-rich repeat extensin-like protein 3 [Iris pallida]